MAKHFQVDTDGTLTTSLVSYYKLEDATEYYIGGGTFDLTNHNTVAFSTGKVNNGADFGSTNTTKYLGTSSNLGILSSSNFSWFGWVKIETAPSANTQYNIFNLWWDTQKGSFEIWYEDVSGTKNLRFRRAKQGVSNDDRVVAQTLTVGTWYQIGYTYNGTNLQGYFNGSTLGSALASSGDGSAANAIGFNLGSNFGANQFSSSMVDEVGVWSKVVSTQEITDLYNSGSGQTMVDSTAFSRSLTDSISTAASRSVTVAQLRGYARTASDSIMTGASRSVTVARIFSGARSASDSVMNGASRLVTLSGMIIHNFIRNLSDSIMNGASRFTILTFKSSALNYLQKSADAVLTYLNKDL